MHFWSTHLIIQWTLELKNCFVLVAGTGTWLAYRFLEFFRQRHVFDFLSPNSINDSVLHDLSHWDSEWTFESIIGSFCFRKSKIVNKTLQNYLFSSAIAIDQIRLVESDCQMHWHSRSVDFDTSDRNVTELDTFVLYMDGILRGRSDNSELWRPK